METYFDLLPNELNLLIFFYITDPVTIVNLNFEPFLSLLSNKNNLINLVNMTTDIRKYINLQKYFDDSEEFLILVALYRQLIRAYNYMNKYLNIYIQEFDHKIDQDFPGKTWRTLREIDNFDDIITDKHREWKVYTSFVISDPKTFSLLFSVKENDNLDRELLSKILMINSSKVVIELNVNIFGYDITNSIDEYNLNMFRRVGINNRFTLWLHPSEEEFKKLYFNFYLSGKIKENVMDIN